MTLGFKVIPNSCSELNVNDMERKNISSLLPHNKRKSAKRLLVKIAATDGDILLLRNKMRSKSSSYEEFKSKKLKSADKLSTSSNLQPKEESPVLPPVVKFIKQRIVRLPSQDDLWKSIKSNYFFIMDNNLINECQKTTKELSLHSPPSSQVPVISQQPISFPEFVERFNILHDKLHFLQTSLEDSTKQGDLSEFQSEKDQLDGEYTFLCDQAAILQRLDPELRDDVGRRCTILKNKWEILDADLWPKKKLEEDDSATGLITEIRSIWKWLREVDEKLRQLNITDKSSPEEAMNIYNEEKVLQREIEERGKEINSLVRLCESTADGATAAHHPPRFRRCVLHLERSWHHIWIRSLENQCLTEQHLLRHAAATTQNAKESSELDSDEGPLRKHRRLKVDHWTAVTATMDRLKMEQTKRASGALKSGGLRTRDVGVLCSERVPVNDKCIMVGTTGIAALKAEYGDDFTNFEIIQDVGYSSESSTHLSGDDTGLDQHFNVRIYKYSKDNQPTPLTLREEFESVARLRDFHSLGSSLESSSSAAASLDDSGLGTGENLTTGDSGDVLSQFREEDDYGQEELDYLETVLDECIDFGTNVASEPEELHFNLSGLDSDDPSDNFQNRSSFTTSAQKFYKMISVDSDNGETENNNNENNNISSVEISESNVNNISSETISEVNANDISSVTTTENNVNNNITSPANISSTADTNFADHLNKNLKCTSSDSDPDTFRPVVHETCHSSDWGQGPQIPHRAFCSTPVRNTDKCTSASQRHQGVKRKRDHDSADAARMSNRVRSWLNRCSDFSIPSRHRRPLPRASPDLPQLRSEDFSSCDASCEGTSSSADEGNNVYSSMSSLDDVFRQKLRGDSCSAGGSVETVVHALLDSEFPFLLPPPPSSTASFGSESKNCSTVCCRLKKRGRRLKATSDGDLGKISSLKEISNLPVRYGIQKQNLLKPSADPQQRLYSSLPSVLRHFSDSSTDDNFIPSTLPSHSDTKTTGFAHHSSSSDVDRRRRRRSRKKSSSSNRSSTSALQSSSDRGRHRSRTVTSSTSRCGSRGRHVSQRSEYFCPEMLFSDAEKAPLKVDIPPEEENVGFVELHRASSALLSPVESDIVLTHLEEQSTVSDQVWDGYQEMPYLSEGYSEATVDEDAVRKLTEFGDDYGSAIGQPLRLLDPPDTNNNKADGLKSPKKSPKSLPVTQRVSSISDDSDSDSEDLYYVIEEAGKALHFARAILKRRQGGDSLTSADYAELLATCGTHLRCLQTICKHIHGKEHNFSASHLKQLHFLIEQWQVLQRNTEMFEKSEDPARQKYLKAQENIDALFNKMSQLSSYSYLNIESLASWEDIEKNMSRLQMVLTSLHEAKEQLLSVNLQVHRFTTEYGSDVNYKECSLKEDITELYRQWEDIYEQNGAHLTELETLKSDWEAYDEKFQSLRLRVKEAEFDTTDDACDTISIISVEKDSGRLRQDFEELKQYATPLKDRLKGGDAWKKMEDEMRDLEQRIERQVPIRQRSSSQSENHRSPSSPVEDDADDHFEDAIQQMCEDKNHSSLSIPQKKDVGATTMSPKRKRSRFWRIIRVAVPVQLALVLLYCIACYLEPGCCNTLNNFNFSFTPQLRYFGGRPPV